MLLLLFAYFFAKLTFSKKFIEVHSQGFSLASAIGHSPDIVPDVHKFAVQFGQFVRDNFRKRMYGNAQLCNSIFVL